MRLFIVLALIASTAPGASAQRTFAGAQTRFPVSTRPSAPFPARVATSVVSLPEVRPFHKHGLPFGPYLYPFGIFSDFNSPDDFSRYSAASQPSLNLVEVLSALNPPQEQPQPVSQPLLIELQGNRYVRISAGDAANNESAYQEIPASKLSPAPTKAHASAKAISLESSTEVLAPVLLVFHDGHTEEVRDYTIANGAIYARGNFYSDGYWNKKIELSALDLSQTVKSNATRGVHFELPNAPNEVITRP